MILIGSVVLKLKVEEKRKKKCGQNFKKFGNWIMDPSSIEKLNASWIFDHGSWHNK